MKSISDDNLSDFRLQQVHIANSIVLHDKPDNLANKIKIVAGADISWINLTNGLNDNKGVAIIVVLEYPSMKLLHKEILEFISNIPYISGFLGFREVPQYIELWKRVKQAGFHPELIFVDGFGILHPVECGSASICGVKLDIPTIGVGKSINLGGCDKNDKEIKQELLGNNVLEIPLLKNGKIMGKAIRKSIEHKQPVYVSIGHKISLETAVEVTKNCMIYKIPEPIRQADLISREYIRKILT